MDSHTNEITQHSHYHPPYNDISPLVSSVLFMCRFPFWYWFFSLTANEQEIKTWSWKVKQHCSNVCVRVSVAKRHDYIIAMSLRHLSNHCQVLLNEICLMNLTNLHVRVSKCVCVCGCVPALTEAQHLVRRLWQSLKLVFSTRWGVIVNQNNSGRRSQQCVIMSSKHVCACETWTDSVAAYLWQVLSFFITAVMKW